MKLVIERNYGGFYAYFESEKHHKRMRRSASLDASALCHECDLKLAMKPGDHIVIDVDQQFGRKVLRDSRKK